MRQSLVAVLLLLSACASKNFQRDLTDEEVQVLGFTKPVYTMLRNEKTGDVIYDVRCNWRLSALKCSVYGTPEGLEMVEKLINKDRLLRDAPAVQEAVAETLNTLKCPQQSYVLGCVLALEKMMKSQVAISRERDWLKFTRLYQSTCERSGVFCHSETPELATHNKALPGLEKDFASFHESFKSERTANKAAYTIRVSRENMIPPGKAKTKKASS